ncbi:MAG: YihY/virulence factor BrkB family protein [Clostridiales bacterium]|nr:YihY/virulence factor BrkB family protein [Clostridiales bacterium]
MSDFWRNTIKKEDNEKKKVKFSTRRLLKVGFHLWRQFDDPYYSGFAAQISYYFFMSSIPMLIVLSQVLGLFDISMDFIKDWLDGHLSSQMGSTLVGLFTASSATITNLLMIILALWSASSLSFSLSRLTTYTLSNGKYRFNFITERLKAIPLATLSIIVVAIALVVYVYGEIIALKIFKSKYMLTFLATIRTPMLAVFFCIAILANYYLLPRIRVPIAAVFPGAVVATFGVMLVTWVYSQFTSFSTNYNILYGAFSNIIALMLWFYLISWVLCIGMMFNKSWDIHMRRGRLTPEKIKEYLINQYGEKGDHMYSKLMIGDYDMTNRALDTMAVRASRRFDPGYDSKREREIRDLEEKQRIWERVERERISEIERMSAEEIDNDIIK